LSILYEIWIQQERKLSEYGFAAISTYIGVSSSI